MRNYLLPSFFMTVTIAPLSSVRRGVSSLAHIANQHLLPPSEVTPDSTPHPPSWMIKKPCKSLGSKLALAQLFTTP